MKQLKACFEEEGGYLWYWVSAVGVTAGILLFCHWPEIVQSYCLYPDLTFQYVFNIFSPDPLVQSNDRVALHVMHYVGWLHSPFWYMIVGALVRWFMPIREALVSLSLIQGFTVFVLLFYVYRRQGPLITAWASALIFAVFSLSMDSLYGGMGRGFGFLTTLFFFFAFLRNNFQLLALAFVLGAGFYLPSLPGMACLVIVECIQRIRHKSCRADSVWAWIACGVVGLYVGFWVYMYYPIVTASKTILDYKYVFSPPLIMTGYRFGGEGLSLGDTFNIWDNFLNCILNFNEHGTSVYVVLMGIFIIMSILGSFILPEYRRSMMRAYMFIAAFVSMFLLMSVVTSSAVASRLCVIAIPIACAYIGVDLIMRLPFQWIRIVISIGILCGLLIWCPHNNVRDFSRYKDIYTYLAEQKKKGERGVVAGSLSVVESVPFFTHWDAYYMSSWAIMPRTGQMSTFIASREKELLYLLYGGREGIRSLESFIERNAIRYFILDEEYLNREYIAVPRDPRMTGLFLPHIKEIVHVYNREGAFPLMEQARKCAIIRSGSVYLVPANALQEAMRSSHFE